jgi:hypothetical protein
MQYRNDADVPEDTSWRYQYGRTEWRDLEGAVQHALDHGATGVTLEPPVVSRTASMTSRLKVTELRMEVLARLNSAQGRSRAPACRSWLIWSTDHGDRASPPVPHSAQPPDRPHWRGRLSPSHPPVERGEIAAERASRRQF